MNEQETTLFVIVTSAVIISASLILALWLVTRLRRKSDRPLSQEMPGVTVIPVRGLRRYFRFFGRSENSISPRLECTRDGLQFKVFKPDFWAFSDIAEVDAPWVPFTTRVAIRSHEAGRLFIDLANVARARDLLNLLPRDLRLTQRAIDLRDGTA